MSNNPEIRVGADLSAAEKAVDEFNAKLDAASKPIDVSVNTEAAEKALDALADAAKNADDAASMPGANAGAKQLAAELERTRRLQSVLAREGIKASREQAQAARDAFSKWRDSGARGTRRLKGQELEDFLGGGWRGAALSEVDAKRARGDVLRAVGLEGGGPGGRSLGRFVAESLGATGRAAAGQALPHGGVGGRIAAQGVAEAAGAGGMLSGAGLGRLAAGGAIGAAAFGLIKLVGGVVSKLDGAQNEGVQRSDMVRSMGFAVDEFDRLRSSAAALAQGLDVTTAEATQLARSYGTAAGFGQNDQGRLVSESAEAGRFARQTGMDVSATAGAFAQLRRSGQDSPERVGKSIVDAMSRRGDFGRMGEVLEALRSFATDVNGGSRTRANTDEALALAARLANLDLPGMGSPEALGAAASMDAGFRRGAGGEAGDMLLLGGLQRMGLPVSGYDVASVREAGLMAKLSDVFGSSSPAFKAAQAAGNQPEMERLQALAGAGGTTLDMVFKSIQGRYSSLAEQASAMQSMTGSTRADAQAFMAAMHGGGVQGVRGRLGAMQIDTSGMSAAQLIAASGVMGDSQEGLERRRRDMLARKGDGALTEGQKASLNAADTPEKLREALLKLASAETVLTDGERTRTSLATINTTMESFAAKLVPAVTAVRDLLADVARKFGVISQDDVDRIKGITPIDRLRRDVSDATKEREGLQSSILSWSGPHQARIKLLGDQIEAKQAKIRELEAADAAAKVPAAGAPSAAAVAESGRRSGNVAALAAAPSQYDDLFKRAGKQHGVDWRDLKLLAAQESGMRPDAVGRNTNGTEDLGLMQHNSRYLADRGLTREDAMDPEKAVPAAAKLFSDLLQQHGGDRRKAYRAYNGSGPKAEAYADSLMRSRAALDAKLPAAAADAPAGKPAGGAMASPSGYQIPEAQLQHMVSIVLKNPQGGTLAEVPPVKLSDGRPRAAGTDTNWSVQ